MERTVSKEGICEPNVLDSGPNSSIGPTSVDFISAIEKKETEKCRHFSIRAYVAEFRRKDWNICWPFSSIGDNEESEKQSDMLPPLQVPEFRCWSCQNCLQRSDAADIRLVSNSASEDKVCGSRNSDVNTPVDVISSENCPLIHDHLKEQLANVMSLTRQDVLSSENYGNTVVRDVDKTIKEPFFCELKIAECVNGEVSTGEEKINLNLENSGMVKLGDENCGSSVVDKRMSKIAKNIFAEVFQKEKPVVSMVAKTSEQVEEMTHHDKPAELGTLESKVEDSLIGCRTRKRHPSLESSENDDDDEKDTHDLDDQLHAGQQGYSSHPLSSRKPQKYRLLTDILGREASGAFSKISSSNGEKNSDHDNTEVTQTKAADELDGVGLVNQSGGQIAVQEYVEKRGRNKKRKTLQAEDQEPLRMTWSKSVPGNDGVYKSDQENSCFDAAIANSKSVSDTFVWEGLHSDFKSQYSETRADRNVIQSKKKNKKTQVEDREEEGKGIGAGTLQLSNDRHTERSLHHSLTLNLALQEIGIHSGVSNEKATHRKAVVSDPQTCQDVYFRSSKTDIVPAKTAKKRTLKRGLHNFVKFCMASEKTDTASALPNKKQEVPQVGSGKTPATTHHKEMPNDHVMTKEIEVKHAGLKIKKATPRKARSGMKQNDTSRIQDGACPIWSKDLSMSNTGKNVDVRGHPAAKKDQSNGSVSKMVESESLNDIPFEIVELLAKNRHERRRQEAENANGNICLLETTKNMKDSENFWSSAVCEDDMSRNSCSRKDLDMQKRKSSNARDGISAAGRSFGVEPVEESVACSVSFGVEPVEESVTYSAHLKQKRKSSGSNIKHLEESHGAKGNFALSVCPVNHSSGNQLAEAGTGKNIGVQSCRSDGDMLVHGWYDSSLQCLTSRHKRRIVSSPTRIREAQRVSLPNVADDTCGIESPQKFANSSHRENRNILLEIFKKTNGEQQPCACTQKKIGKFPNPVSPLDLYTNKTMPATQLLKLMHAGMSSRGSKDVDEKMEFQTTHRKKLLPMNGVLKDASEDHRIRMSVEHFPSVPLSSAVPFPVQRYKNCVGRSRIAGQTCQQMVSDKVKSKSGCFGRKHESSSINGLQAEIHPLSNSMIVPLTSQLIKGSIDNVEVATNVGTVELVKGSCGTDLCSLNRNPADFSIPEAGNEFTIGGSDRKSRKTVSKRGRPRLRMMKLVALNEPEQN